MSSDIAIKVENLSKCYQIYEQPRDRLKQFVMPRIQRAFGKQPKQYYREFWALKDVSFEVKKGETVGIIGRNGSGKSTLLQLICGTLNATGGTVTTQGRIAALLELGSGFNPEFTGRENVYMNAAVLGLSTEEIEQRFDAIVAFADIGEFIEQPVKTYSSGMMVRLAFAVAINVEPDILVVDEALAVGDAAFQRKCLRRINDLSQSGVTILFVSHDIETIRKLCTRAAYLNRGVMLGSGSAKDICMEYERDLFGAGNLVEASVGNDEIALEPVNLGKLDPDLLNSAERSYGDGGALITEVLISNKNDQRINVIDQGLEISVSYKTEFISPTDKPIFGMMITNREGVCVFGTNTEGEPCSSRFYNNGEVIEIKFLLNNNLGPGTYYLTCGVHASEDEKGLVYLQRRMDALIFKSICADGIRVAGSANLYPRIQFQRQDGDGSRKLSQ